MNLQSKTAIVTGASSGIGATFSEALTKSGATVFGLARNEAKLKTIAEKLGAAFIPVRMDITKAGDLEDWVSSTFSSDSQPDILINNAGLGFYSKVDDLGVDQWDTMVQTNLSGVFYLTKVIVPLMKTNPNVCHIVNIASVAGLIGNPNFSGYNATKFGLRGFSEAIMKELRYDGIKVTCLFPGSIQTSFFDDMDEITAHGNMMQAEDVAQVMINVLETPDNMLIDELALRPLNPKQG